MLLARAWVASGALCSAVMNESGECWVGAVGHYVRLAALYGSGRGWCSGRGAVDVVAARAERRQRGQGSRCLVGCRLRDLGFCPPPRGAANHQSTDGGYLHAVLCMPDYLGRYLPPTWVPR